MNAYRSDLSNMLFFFSLFKTLWQKGLLNEFLISFFFTFKGKNIKKSV